MGPKRNPVNEEKQNHSLKKSTNNNLLTVQVVVVGSWRERVQPCQKQVRAQVRNIKVTFSLPNSVKSVPTCSKVSESHFMLVERKITS